MVSVVHKIIKSPLRGFYAQTVGWDLLPNRTGAPPRSPVEPPPGGLRPARKCGPAPAAGLSVRKEMDHAEQILKSLHPACRDRFVGFQEAIKRTAGISHVRAFEGHRSPEKQDAVRLAGNSKVGGWHSVHQYGFACDFVPCPGGKWTWEFDQWDRLHELAAEFGLFAPIPWDRPHIVVMDWKRDLRNWLRDARFT